MGVSARSDASAVTGKRCPRTTCAKRGVVQPRDAFHKDRRNKDGLESWCKACVRQYNEENKDRINAYRRERYRANREREREKSRTYYATNDAYREKALEKDRAYYRANREKIAAYDRERNQRNAEKNLAYNRAYLEAHPEKSREYNARYHARKRGATVESVSYERILARDGHWCYLCENDVAPNEVSYDHVVPLSRGGAHSEANIKVVHRSCNSRKLNRLLSELKLPFQNG